jgi:hypothetical protein
MCGNIEGRRSFFTKEEKIEILQDYKEKLEQETKGVDEAIKELKKNN